MNSTEKEPSKEALNSPSQTLTIVKQTSFISSYEPNLSNSHTFRCIKKREPWTEEEDKTIKQLVNKYGTSNWTLISSKMGKSRSGKQCRERWYNQLNPSIQKKNWTKEEENILFSKHMSLGNKWSDIGSYLPGRTLNDIKNHFYSKLRKFIRKILKQINDENLFEINGIDSCKYSGDKIYKMIKKNEITLKNLTKDTIFELIIATEKNPKGKLIFFNDNSRNFDINNNYNEINNNTNININNNLGYLNECSYEKYNYNNNIQNDISNNNNNYFELNIEPNENDNSCNNFKLKLRKYSNFSESVNPNDTYFLKNSKNTNNIKSPKKNKNKKKFNKENNDINIISDTNINIINNNNQILSKKRKKSTKKNECDTNIPELKLSQDNKKKPKKSSKKNSSLEKNYSKIEGNSNNNNNIQKNINLNDIKLLSKTELNENNSSNNLYNFYYPFNITSPKTIKTIQIPHSITKSNKEDFSFSKINSLNNEYFEPSLHKGSIFPINCDNLFLYPQKNKNNYVMSDLSYENNNLLKSRGSCYMNSKNDNTYKNLSINGNNIYYKQNNNLSTNKSLDEKIKEENNKVPAIINIDLINHQEFTNAFINGNNNADIDINNDRSQFNNFIYNKNNNNLKMFNVSSPPSVKSL